MRLYSYIKEKLTRGENETSSNNKKLTSEDIKRKWERVEYDKYLNDEHPITVGDSIIFIEGSLSKKVLSIESHNCDISD